MGSFMTTAFLLVVFDGLRPDMIQSDTTPNLMRFAAMGTRFARARSVFPSETRVCSASVATGCHPARHGLVANRFAHPRVFQRSVDTGRKEALLAFEQETGAPVLQAPTLAQALHAAGQELVVLSSGTTGQTYILNPDADALEHVTLSAHGVQACSRQGARLLASLDPPPAAPADRAVWVADLFRTRFLPSPPACTVVWLCEPDTSGHHQGLGSPAQLDALRAADAAFGRILDDWQAGPQRDTLQIAVASDHGQATITGHRVVAEALAASPGFDGCQVLPGSSGGIAIPDADGARVAAAAEWLMRQDWIGNLFAVDGLNLPEGVLPHSAVLLHHPRTAPLIYTLRTDPGPSPLGLPGTTLMDGGLPVGSGTHGGLSPAEMRITLMLAGSRIRAGMSEWPAGLVDLAPSILALLGIPGGASMDGRPLTEAFTDGLPPAHSPAAESWEALYGGYSQRLTRTRLGRHVTLDAAFRLPVA
jgi:phosphonoacetate hydrolase